MTSERARWSRQDVAGEAVSWVGTRYHHGQAHKGVGCDCIGFVGGVARELGMPCGAAWAEDPTLKGYGRIPDPAMLMPACAKYLLEIDIGSAGLGDVLLLRWRTHPHHFALIVQPDPTRIVHGYAAAGVVCETPIDGKWRNHVTWRSLIISAWRFRELQA